MRPFIVKTLIVCALLVMSAIVSAAQSQQVSRNSSEQARTSSSSRSDDGNPVLNATGKVAVVVVKSAAKGVWATTKFAAKNVGKPILFKVVPKLAKYSLRGTGLAAKHLLPYAAKLAVL